MTRLRIGDGFSLPLDVVTQTIAALAKRRAGKSYTIAKIVEELFRTGQQVVIVDPKGDWWGIRSSADGKGPGVPVVILGGSHGDVPLEPGSGEVVGRMVVEERISLLLDLSDFRKSQVPTFMAPFLETVYRLKARDEYRTAMMMAVDEADAIAPQRPFKGEERMLGAMEDVIRRGGQRGIGCIMATQRPAVLNKNVLTQSQILIALRLIAPQDRDALEAWIEIHGTKAQQETLMDSLGSLPTGTAWFWSPGWPDEAGIFKRVQVGQRTTFDSFRTPAPGEKRLEPKTLADVDLEALRKRMAATIERAKAEDPKELRKQLAEARAALAKAQKAQPAPAVSAEPKIVKVPILKDKQLSRLEKILTRLDAIRTRTGEELLSLKPMVDSITGAIAKSKAPVPIPYQAPQVRASMPAPAKTVRQPADCQSTDLGKGELCILTAVAQYPDGIIREQLTVMTGYRRSSRDTYLQRLRSGGLVEDRAGRIVATEAGVASLGPDFEPLPTGEALREHLMATLPEGERRILGFLIEKYPKEVSREEIDEATGYKRSSRDTYLQRLSARRLWESVAGKIRAAEVLFQEG